jgi:hypothetical protein
MRNRKKVAFLAPDHLEQQADARASEAMQLPEGEARQNAVSQRSTVEGVRFHEARNSHHKPSNRNSRMSDFDPQDNPNPEFGSGHSTMNNVPSDARRERAKREMENKATTRHHPFVAPA